MNIFDFYQKKEQGHKISMVTCYDYTTARILADTAIDCLLVGDSVSMVMHGFENTLAATVEMMRFHIAAVSRGTHQFIIADMPFLSYRQSLSNTMATVQTFMQAGAHAIKLEGSAGNLECIHHITESGVPVMGHIGLTPQLLHQLGGYKVQGKTETSVSRLKQEALALQQAGCFSIVLECVPPLLAKEITEELKIPTIGVGAGSHTNGQVLVLHDLLGLTMGFKPKFVKSFMNGSEQIQQSIENYIRAINQGEFPDDEHSY